ncbi:MAG: hypothetical protein B7Y15_10445 [Bacteroidetes bacterium 24-39-8]|jgi:hypothetical protein|nr:MAG: hypothetical protein B7Y69_08400 [Sphingobacteriia bacterium 35-40-8]OYZ49335.1 MAG: hypothetical protein B7Y15_10445 [Bacteroidetes bacterium 24-39-8]OZA66729.1 MAG: hypothetical protein B7X72_05190 [Sphingobacteriia bacterium 39-39-8]HQR93921.1 hypothetical protein [Sediminibacterium sp.]HQS54829.1 hypothetical protein [Sediminibacterium sp.]
MNQFSQIDNRLKILAKEIGAILETKVGRHSINGVDVPKEKLALRQIQWVDGPIGKAIIINQNFENGILDSPNWDFFNIAWLQEGKTPAKGRPFWNKCLLKNIAFKIIESEIDQLVKMSLENLNAINKTDLK